MRADIGKLKARISFSLIIAAIAFLTGCGAGKTMVLKPSETKLQFASVDIFEGKSTVDVPEADKALFQEKLSKFVYEEGGFQKGNDLKIAYRFIQFNPGSQFTRYMWGGLGSSGEGTLTVEAKYSDVSDNEIATIQTEGKISSGVFGGSFSFAIENCAKEIAEYTKKNFR
jgi:Domain of unknown function (DUF4410)